MPMSRRDFVVSAAAAGVCWQGLAQEQAAAFTLSLPETEFDPTLPLMSAVTASTGMRCQMLVMSGDEKEAVRSKEWVVKGAGDSVTAKMQWAKDTKPGKFGVQMKMQPDGAKRPSVAVVLTQEKTADASRLRQMSLAVPFKDDPAKPPGGHFELDLSTDSAIRLQIWKGESAKGAPIFAKMFGHVGLGAGTRIIGWNLKTTQGLDVLKGRYFASLVCTPYDKTFLPTYFGAYFAVISDL
jgi:hypothetical protein